MVQNLGNNTTMPIIEMGHDMRMPDVALKPVETGAKTSQRDAWTGGIEWRQILNFRNLFWTVLVVYLIYLFLKHMLPLIKKSVAK